MEQIYMIEIFVDRVAVFVRENDDQDTDKKIILKFMFGPKIQLDIKEGYLVETSPEERKEDVVQTDENGMKKWCRTIRVGKSYLFSSYPDFIVLTLSNFPLEIELWSDDPDEVKELIGSGTMKWNPEFFTMLKANMNPKKIYEPFAMKQSATIDLECCCVRLGEVDIITRLTALGPNITTEFQQLIDSEDPNAFVFRTNKSPTMIHCKKLDGDDPNFCMLGSLYESISLEDPDVIANAFKKIDICTKLRSCGASGSDRWCKAKSKTPTAYPIEKIRMGDIIGPCGNPNCALAHRIKAYIRKLETYKLNTKDKQFASKDLSQKPPCGLCSCADDRWHRDSCPTHKEKAICPGCGGLVHDGKTCEDKRHRKGINIVSAPEVQEIRYLTSIERDPELMKSVFRQDFVVNPCEVNYYKDDDRSIATNDLFVYNVDKGEYSKKSNLCNLDVHEEKVEGCKCNPPTPTPPCKTVDCECLTETVNIASRNRHKPFCPSYQHKTTCPVTTMNDEENEEEKEEDEPEPLPYGLPPIHFTPCPILGRPCILSEGFARTYRAAVMPTQQPNWSEAGKVCCSKEYERIKKAMKEYMEKHKDKCHNKYNLETERKCCNKEQRLLALTGRSCCGSYKIKDAKK